jgi:hypothetical protein
MQGALRKVLKIFGFPAFVGIWIVGWSLCSICDEKTCSEEQLLKENQKILVIERNAIKKAH